VRRDHERAERRHEQRVAVGRRALDERGADGAGGARLVVDDPGAAQLLGQLLRQHARDGVGGAARRERHDQRDGLVAGQAAKALVTADSAARQADQGLS
jgi:hypothetical protein